METLDWIVYGITTLFVVVGMICYIQSKKYDAYFSSVPDGSVFLTKDFYPIGYAFLKMIRFNFKNPKGQIILNSLKYLYGEKEAEFYLEVTYARTATLILFFLPFSGIIYGLSGELILPMLLVLVMVVLAMNALSDPQQLLIKRNTKMTIEFADVTSKLAILTNAGMLLREAWKTVAFEGSGALYEQMQQTVLDMENGASDSDAIREFGNRCNSSDIRKFSATVVQNLEKGSGDLPQLLMDQSRILWEIKKQEVRRAATKAAENLIWPTVLIFIGIVIMIIIPMLQTIQV